jgi:hypothetical protein
MTSFTNPSDKVLTLRMGLMIASYAALLYSMRKNMIHRRESLWVGGAILFCAVGWLLPAVIVSVEGRFGSSERAVLISSVMILPLIITMTAGIWLVYRRMR